MRYSRKQTGLRLVADGLTAETYESVGGDDTEVEADAPPWLQIRYSRLRSAVMDSSKETYRGSEPKRMAAQRA